jgi:hypothetical protein
MVAPDVFTDQYRRANSSRSASLEAATKAANDGAESS